jgi:putative ABC transport system permease protein
MTITSGPGTSGPGTSGPGTSGPAATSTPAPPAPARLRLSDLAGLASVGLRTRKLRAALSALGIGIGVAAIVAVLGLASSSQAGLLAEISQLGTNLLTAANGTSLAGQPAELPDAAPGMVGQLPGVLAVQYTGAVNVDAYRSPLVPAIDTNGLSVAAASLGLPAALGTSVAQGSYLNAATAREPVAVLGAEAAQLLGIDRIWPGERIWVGGQWFYLAGILKPAALAPQIDVSILVGFPAAQAYLGFDGHPSELYVRTVNTAAATTSVDNLLAAQANPEYPNEVNVSQPSQALTAQADAAGAFDTLFLGLGAVALLVGAVGVANIMIISVLERRQEIGLRRALGATKGQIRVQFLAEAILLSLAGGVAGDLAGAAATAVYAHAKGWAVVIPPDAWAGGLGAALLIGALAGLLPAIRAARMSPTQALWTL